LGGTCPVRDDLDVDEVEITAGRLHLRPFRPTDAAAVYAACQDPEIQRWTQVPAPYSAADARAFVEVVAPGKWAGGTGAVFAILDSTSGELLGAIGLEEIRPDGDTAEIGFWAAAPARRRGVMTQAASVLCRWGFAELGLRRITWCCLEGNHASRGVAEHVGFRVDPKTRTGTLRRDGRRRLWTGELRPEDLR
jgi:RimJ/RimL family protein N-acetyltransferase